MKCVCPSLSPGTMVRPAASITWVFGPRSFSTSAAVPTAATTPPRIAIALAVGARGFSVAILALVMRSSAGLTLSCTGAVSQPERISPANPAVAAVSFRNSRRPRLTALFVAVRHAKCAQAKLSHWSDMLSLLRPEKLYTSRQVLAEPRERLRPGGLCRLGVVARARVVVEGVLHVRVHDLAEGLAVLRHRGLDRGDVLVDAVVAARVDREHRRADSLDVGFGNRDAVERHGRAQLGQGRGNPPGHGAAEAEPHHAGAIDARRHLGARESEPAPEILHVARGRRLAEDSGNRVEVVLVGSALARQQVHRQPDVARLRDAPRHVLDVARETAVLMADEHDRIDPGARRAREIAVETRPFAREFRDAGDDVRIAGRDLRRSARRRLGRRGFGLRANVERLRGERGARDAGDRSQGLAPREPPLLVVLDGLFHQIALQVVHAGLLIPARFRPCVAGPPISRPRPSRTPRSRPGPCAGSCRCPSPDASAPRATAPPCPPPSAAAEGTTMRTGRAG